MKMLTAEIKKQFAKLGSQEDSDNPTIVAKFFCPWNNWTWYAYDCILQCSDDVERRFSDTLPDGVAITSHLMFGLVVGHETELCYFQLDELMSIQGPASLKIERDRNFTGTIADVGQSHVRPDKRPYWKQGSAGGAL